MGALDDLRDREQTAADGLADLAAELGSACLTPSTLIVARLAVQSVQRDDRRGTLGEPAADLSALRTSSALATRLEGDLAKAGHQALTLILNALVEGYTMDAHGRAKATEAEAKGITLTVEVTEEDRRDLALYPILGHAPREISRHLTAQLRYEVEGALAAPLTGRIDPATIPTALGDVARKHGDRLAGAVREAFFAGTQAATKAIAAALTGRASA